MTTKTTNKKLNPSNLAKSLGHDNEGTLYHKTNIQLEKELSNKLKLDEKIQEKLQSRHSMTAISRFFDRYSKIIEKEHYLYELPTSEPSARSTTFRPDWCETDKPVYTLDTFSYCLFTRKEYKLACANNVPKGTHFHFSYTLSLY